MSSWCPKPARRHGREEPTHIVDHKNSSQIDSSVYSSGFQIRSLAYLSRAWSAKFVSCWGVDFRISGLTRRLAVHPSIGTTSLRRPQAVARCDAILAFLEKCYVHPGMLCQYANRQIFLVSPCRLHERISDSNGQKWSKSGRESWSEGQRSKQDSWVDIHVRRIPGGRSWFHNLNSSKKCKARVMSCIF